MTFLTHFLKCFCIEIPPNSNEIDSDESTESSDPLESLSLDSKYPKTESTTESIKNFESKYKNHEIDNAEYKNQEIDATESESEFSVSFSSFSDF